MLHAWAFIKPPVAGTASLVLAQSVVRPSTGDYPHASWTATAANGPGNPQDFIGLYDSGGNLTTRWAYLNGSQTPPIAGVTGGTVTIGSPGAIGIWTIRFVSASGAVLASQVLRTAVLTTAQLFPILSPGGYDNNKFIVILNTPASQNSWQQIVSGNVTFTGSWFANGNPRPPDGTVTMRWTIDNVPVSPRLVGPPFTSWVLDTTTLANGTHAIGALFIDSTSGSFSLGNLAYQLRPIQLVIIVANGNTFNNGVQTVPSTDRGFSAGGANAKLADFVTYPGGSLANPVYPYPTTQVIPGSSSPTLRQFSNWYLEGLDRYVNQEYESFPRFCKTRLGGVFVGPFAALRNNVIEGSIHSVNLNAPTDGMRNNNMTEAYSNAVPMPDDTGWAAADLEGGVWKLAWDGRKTTLVGRWGSHSLLPFDFQDNTPTAAEIEATYLHRGTIEAGFNTDYSGANDLCFDPRNPNILYVAQTLAHCIYKADFTTTPPTVTRFAGQYQVAGFANGNARSTALFNSPYSICMTQDGTMYVADHWNHRVRMISPDGQTVSTLFGNQNAPLPTQVQLESGDSIQETNYDLWCPLATQALSTSYAVAPQVLRVTSTGNLILGEAWSMAIRYIDLTAQTIRRVGIFGAAPHSRFGAGGGLIHANGNTWFWADVDSAGTCGPVDDVVFFSLDSGDVGAAAVIWRCSLDGDYSHQFGGDTGYSPTEGGIIGGGGHYPWVIAISRTQGRMLATGAANFGMFGFRIRQPTDPVVSISENIGLDQPSYNRGKYIHNTGSVFNFPWGTRPGFRQLRGPGGSGLLGIPGTEPFDTLMSTYPDDASLGAYIQAGFGGVVPRPEITGDDLGDLIYFIRRTSLPGSFPVPLANRGVFAQDVTAPVISNVTAVLLGSDSMRFTWTTDEPTYGFVACGSPSQVGTQAPYAVFGVEIWGGSVAASYRTSHDVTVENLPTALPTHYSIFSRDMAGNSKATPDAIGEPLITVTPAASFSIPNSTPLGAIVATITVALSTGYAFTGTLSLSVNPSSIYALSSTSTPSFLIINPAGPGVGAQGGNVNDVTILAVQ